MRLTLFAVAALAVMSAGCTVGEQPTIDALEASGYTNVELGGIAMFGCGKDDDFTRAWKATGQNGVRYKGVACSSLFKGVTVRQTGRA